jgi:exosortase K
VARVAQLPARCEGGVSLGAAHREPLARVGAAARVVRRCRWQLLAVVIAAAVVVGGKQLYRDASADALGWILAPTARLVSLATGTHFVYEAGAGWIDRAATFVIAPACAGVNFALAAFLALTLGWLAGMCTLRATAARLAGAAALAYAATLAVNTLRIVVALALHRGAIDLGTLDRAVVHRAEGIIVYLCGLCALYALARALDRKGNPHALAL